MMQRAGGPSNSRQSGGSCKHSVSEGMLACPEGHPGGPGLGKSVPAALVQAACCSGHSRSQRGWPNTVNMTVLLLPGTLRSDEAGSQAERPVCEDGWDGSPFSEGQPRMQSDQAPGTVLCRLLSCRLAE